MTDHKYTYKCPHCEMNTRMNKKPTIYDTPEKPNEIKREWRGLNNRYIVCPVCELRNYFSNKEGL